MRTTRTDRSPAGRARRRCLAAAALAGLLALALSACSKQPEQQAGDGGTKPAPQGEDKDRQATLKRREQSQNNLKQIILALHALHDTYNALPPAAISDKKTGKPLLSWRVAILPYIEQMNLYKQFNLDEPWDGPTNKHLAETVVPVFAPPGAAPGEGHKTYYRGFVASPESRDKTAWETRLTKNPPFGALGTSLGRIPDGTSNTLCVVEAGEAVPWSKPDELRYDPKGPLPKLGGLFKDGFNAALMDGNVAFISRQIDENSLRALITANGGEIIDLDALKQKGLIK
jgi:hypothetical protein